MPTPQAGILDQSTHKFHRIQTKTEHPDFLDQARLRPQQSTKYEAQIIKTLLELQKQGKAENTIHNTNEILKQLSKKTELENPEKVKLYIATATNEKTKQPLANATKNKLCLAYEWYCKANSLTWQKPFYKVAEGTPIIPTTENVTKIISASGKNYAFIFTLLAEIGAEGEELHRTPRSKIDTEQGTITITGTKGHGSATYKLKNKTAEMLREYLAKNPQDYPFPKPTAIGERWRTTRNRVADNLKQPELKNIPLKNLRNYSGAQLYNTLPIRDPIAVMRHLRHKKLETTMHYIRGITLTYEEDIQYISKTSANLQQDQELIDAGYSYVTERDGIKLYRKRK